MHFKKVKAIHEDDCRQGFGHVNLPGALACGCFKTVYR
jgi:hypothetical protein